MLLLSLFMCGLLLWVSRSHRIYRGNVQNLTSSEMFYQADHQLLGIAVDPFSGYILWSKTEYGEYSRDGNWENCQ